MSDKRIFRTWLDDVAERPLEWGAWILRPAAERYPFERGGGITSQPGLYAIYDQAGELLYIGKAASISDRLRTHRRRTMFFHGEPTTASCCVVENETVRHYAELAHVHALTPPDNMEYRGSSWSGHEPMMAAILQAWGRTQ